MWKFEPIFKTTIWGGDKIAPFKGWLTDQEQIGESWELSGVEGAMSVVAEGVDKGLTLEELIKKYEAGLMGKRNYIKFGEHFPLLIKFIDAQEDLSVQVHPDDVVAQKHGMPNGKTEMWYVIDCDKGARLANGFNRIVDPTEYEGLVESGKIEEVLNFMPVSPGDVYYIPAGNVHAIGKGCFIAEIQQTSDATYRIYDYHRKDKDGKERQLHTNLAKEAIDFNAVDNKPVEYNPCNNIPLNIIQSPFFTTNILKIDQELMRDYKESDTFVVIIVISGEAEFISDGETITAHRGETLLIPASAPGLTIIPKGEFMALETYIK